MAILLTINEQWSEAERGYIPPKTKASRRVIYLRDENINFDILERVVIPHVPETPDEFLFKYNGKPIKTSLVEHKLLGEAIDRCHEEGHPEKLTVKRITPHDMRRTFGVQYMMSGGNIWRLHELLGHTDMNTTREHYARYSARDVKKRKIVTERIGNLIRAKF